MAKLQPVRGTHDLLPEEFRRHRHVIEVARTTTARYGFREIATPIFEFSEVFRRPLGDSSDIVTKEMYSFADRSGDEITLRPEATAAIARAFISEGLSQQLPLKFFCSGPMFRYERPQKGRQRQFHQIDVEILGVAEPVADIEVIATAAAVLEGLGVGDRVTLELNTLGDRESRDAYRGALLSYLEPYRNDLSDDSRARLAQNPLRILDSKDEGDQIIVANAPHYGAHLSAEAAAFYDAVREGLSDIGIAYRENPRLVRGLDYYCHTAFEFTTTALGAQGTVIGGGRYDGLIELMGGPPTAGTGWAGGIERLAVLATGPAPEPRPIAVIPVGTAAEREGMLLAEGLRRAGFTVDLGYRGNLSKRMKRANKLNASAALLIGDDELAARSVTLRDLDSGEQRTVARGLLEEALSPYR